MPDWDDKADAGREHKHKALWVVKGLRVRSKREGKRHETGSSTLRAPGLQAGVW